MTVSLSLACSKYCRQTYTRFSFYCSVIKQETNFVAYMFNFLLPQVLWQSGDGLHAPDPWLSGYKYHQLKLKAFLVEGDLQLIHEYFWMRQSVRNIACDLEHRVHKFSSKVVTFLKVCQSFTHNFGPVIRTLQ